MNYGYSVLIVFGIFMTVEITLLVLTWFEEIDKIWIMIAAVFSAIFTLVVVAVIGDKEDKK